MQKKAQKVDSEVLWNGQKLKVYEKNYFGISVKNSGWGRWMVELGIKVTYYILHVEDREKKRQMEEYPETGKSPD